MSAKAISEQTGKEFLYKYICTSSAIQNRFKYARVSADTDWARLTQDHPWLLSEVRSLSGPLGMAEPPQSSAESSWQGWWCCGRLAAELCPGSGLFQRSLQCHSLLLPLAHGVFAPCLALGCS